MLREGAERDRRRLRVLRRTVRGLGAALLAVGGLMLVGQWSAPALLSWAMLEAMMLGAFLGFAHVLWRDSYWTRVARRDEAVSRPE